MIKKTEQNGGILLKNNDFRGKDMKRNILRCFIAYILSILLLSNSLEVFASTLTNVEGISSEESERSDTVISKATDSNAKEWEFTYFGCGKIIIT